MTAQPPFVIQNYQPPAPPAAPEVNIDELMEKYRELRATKDAAKARHSEELAPINTAMDDIEIQLLRVMTLTGLNSFSSGDSTAYKQSRNSWKITDPHEFRQWVEANNCPEMYENRVSKDAMDNYIANGGVMPPGLTLNSEVVVNIRKK